MTELDGDATEEEDADSLDQPWPPECERYQRLELRERQRRGGNPDDVLETRAERRDERTHPAVVVEPPAAACVAVREIIERVDNERAGADDSETQRDDDDDADREQRPSRDRRRQCEQRACQHGERQPGREDEGTVHGPEERGKSSIVVLEGVPPADRRLQPREPEANDPQRDDHHCRGDRQLAYRQRQRTPGIERDRRDEHSGVGRHVHPASEQPAVVSEDAKCREGGTHVHDIAHRHLCGARRGLGSSP